MRLGTILAAAALAAMPSAALADWHVAKSRHFIVYADDHADDLRQFAEKLEKFDSAVRIARRVEDPPIGDGLRLTIYVLDDTDDVSRLAVGSRRSAIAGFYISRAEGAAAPVTDSSP